MANQGLTEEQATAVLNNFRTLNIKYTKHVPTTNINFDRIHF